MWTNVRTCANFKNVWDVVLRAGIGQKKALREEGQVVTDLLCVENHNYDDHKSGEYRKV